MSKYNEFSFKTLVIGIIFTLIIPLFILYITGLKSYDDFLVFLAENWFLDKYGKEYRGYFTYLLGAVINPFLLAVGTSASWLTLVFIIPGSLMKGESRKTKISVCVILTTVMLGAIYAIPITHYPDFIKDFGLVKRGVTKQIEADSYSTYSKREQGGRTYTRHTVYYLYIVGKDGRESFSREFSIGRDLYEYLQDKPNEKIVLNYMPNTGVFLNGQIGDIKFGSQAEEEESAEPDEPNISEGT